MKSFTGPGSTPSRRAFWDQVTAAVNASRKIAGRHDTVSEHPGMGTLINVDDTSARRGSGGGGAIGACCVGDTCIVTTEENCMDLEGTYQGDGTDCDPNPCVECNCICEVDPGTPIPCHVSGTITLNCDCDEFCGVSSHIELVNDDLNGTGCDCFISFVYDFDCDEACTPCHIVGGITVSYDYDASQWNMFINYSYSNSPFVVLCGFTVTIPFFYGGGGPLTIDQDVPNGIPSESCISHVNLTIT